MKNSYYNKFLIKIIVPLSIIIYMSYNICINVKYIIYYKGVINKNKSLYMTLVNNKKNKEENCSEIIEKVSKEKNCILSKVTKDESENLLEINLTYMGNVEELNNFIFRTSKEKNFQDINYMRISNNTPKVQSELQIIFKI